MSRTSIKRSSNFDVEEGSENASKIAKKNSYENFWLYLKADSGNICKLAMKNRSFEKSLAETTKNCPIEMEKVKFFISQGMLRISCRNEVQQKTLLDLKNIDGHPVTVTLPWALTKSNKNDQVFKESKQKAFKYVISGVSVDITDDEIKEAAKCMEVNRISKQDKNKLVKTETVILSFQSEQLLPGTIHFGMLKFKLRAYVPSPMRCKSCLGYGHTSKHCTHQPRCLHCGNTGHNYDACVIKNEAARCANCGGGHVASDKTCPKFIQMRDHLRKTATSGRPTYSRALTGDTNTTAVAGALNVPDDKIESLKLDFESSLEKFASQVTNDIQKVLSEFGHEIQNIKTTIAEIRSYRNESGTKLEKCEKAIDSVRKENLELSSKLATLEIKLHACEEGADQVADLQGKFMDRFPDDLNNLYRYTVDCIKLLFVKFGSNFENSGSFKDMEEITLENHEFLTRANKPTNINKAYWPSKSLAKEEA